MPSQRVIVFHFQGPACDDTDPCPPGIHPYYRFTSNSQWNLQNLNQVANSTFSCSFTQIPQPLGTTFFGLNNFVVPPVQSSARTMNEYEYLANRIETCSNFHDGLDVNFVYVDFWNEGEVPRLVQDRNAAKALRRKLSQSHK